MEYLVLRYQTLKELPGMSIRTLDPLYERDLKGELTEEDRKHLSALIRKVGVERPEYSPENLAAVYAYSFWIRIALERLPGERHDFLKKMLLQVLKTLHLTVAQAEGVNRWLARIEGLPVLDARAFVGHGRR